MDERVNETSRGVLMGDDTDLGFLDHPVCESEVIHVGRVMSTRLTSATVKPWSSSLPRVRHSCIRRRSRIHQRQFIPDEDIAFHPLHLEGRRNLKVVDIVHTPLFALPR